MRNKLLRAALAVWVLSATARGDSAWPQWRGPARDGKAVGEQLLTEWPAEGPKLLWMAGGLGSGCSSLAIADGRIFTLGHTEDDEELIAVSADQGQPLWKLTVGKGDHSNGTPTIDGDRVYAIGLQGDLVCAEARTGKLLWRKNFEQDFGGRMMSGWGYSESPLIDGDMLICTPGASDATMVALDKRTGDLRWRASVPEIGEKGTDGAGYSSIVVSEAAGVRQYVQLTGRGLIGVRASDGEFLWSYNAIANGTANIPTPIVSGDNVFCSTGYGTGAALLKLSPTANGVSAKEVYFLNSKVFQNHHGGMIQVGDFIYAGHQHNEGFPICLKLSTGEVVWGGSQRGPGRGSAAILYADGHLIFRYEDGTVALVEASSSGYHLKSKFKPAFQEGTSWAHPVVVNGRLYLREQDRLMCYDIARTP